MQKRGADRATKAPRWRRWLLEILVVIAIVLAVNWWQSRHAVRGPAPALSGRVLSGESIALPAVHDRATLVYFWATWCPVCAVMDGTVNELAADWPVVTVAMQSGDAAAVSAHLAEAELRFPVLLDADGGLAARWGVRGVPTSFFVDATGEVRFVATGYTTEWGMRLRYWLADW